MDKFVHLIGAGITVLMARMVLTYAVYLSTPKNQVALVGTRVELECSTNLSQPLTWSFYPTTNPRDLTTIFLNGALSRSLSSVYDVEQGTGGRYNLVIRSVDVETAGEYVCSEDSFGRNAVRAQITVIASEPVCVKNSSSRELIENDLLWLTCSLSYTGYAPPSVEWQANDGRMISGSLHRSVDGWPVVITSAMNIQVNASDNGKVFSCNTIFWNSTKSPVTNETSLQDSNSMYTWNFSADVHYGPRDLRIDPLNETFASGDRLHCSADGNPTPSYEWTELRTGKVKHGTTLTVTDDLNTDLEHTFECVAVNHVSRSQPISVKFNITSVINEENQLSGTGVVWHPIHVTIVVLLAFLCFTLAISTIAMYSKNSKSSRHRRSYDRVVFPEPTYLEILPDISRPPRRDENSNTSGEPVGNYEELKPKSEQRRSPYTDLHIHELSIDYRGRRSEERI